MKLPKKVLIANRGEIAVRVMRTCQRLGVRTVAVYSEPDSRSLHVESADEAVALGGSTAIESYLNIDKILDACKSTGCDAVHPGYGFLSENAVFAQRVADAGIAFVGPPASAIELLGDKISAKRTATRAGTPTVPGTEDPLPNAKAAIAAAAKVGYPVLLKPSAGGGGKGMHIVHSEDEIAAALASCQEVAAKAFGDDRCLHRALRHATAPHRNPDPRRFPRQLRVPERAGVLDPTPLPEGDRGSTVAGPHSRAAKKNGGVRLRLGAGVRLRERGDGRIHRRPETVSSSFSR